MSQTATETRQTNRTVAAELQYYLDPSLGGDDHFYPGTAGNYRRKKDIHAMSVTDMRGSEQEFSLDKQGFEVHKHESTEKDFVDQGLVKTIVYDETSELLKRATGATHVHPFSHITRTATWESALAAAADQDGMTPIPKVAPARFIHVDQSYAGAAEVLRDNLPAEQAARLSKGRWGIINVWRPIHKVVTRDPLGVCDARSVDAERDLVPMVAQLPGKGSGTYEDVSAGGGFETWGVRYSEKHRWYYCSGLSPEEVLLIKCFDSANDGRAKAVPHSAFPLPGQGGPARESIEVRCLVFWGQEGDCA